MASKEMKTGIDPRHAFRRANKGRRGIWPKNGEKSVKTKRSLVGSGGYWLRSTKERRAKNGMRDTLKYNSAGVGHVELFLWVLLYHLLAFGVYYFTIGRRAIIRRL